MSKRFEFRLQRALAFYRQSLAAEKAALQRTVAEIYELERMMEALERRKLQEQAGIQQGAAFLGRDLAGLTIFLASVRDEIGRLKNKRAHVHAKLVEQRRSVAASHRRVRLLEELESRRKSDWQREVSVEEDSQASELFLAASVREAALEEDAAVGGA